MFQLLQTLFLIMLLCYSCADPRTWWYNTEDNSYSGKCLGGPAYGFEETLQTIKTGMDNLGPFDGLLGFSQGACLVGLLAAMQQKRCKRCS